MSAISPIVAPGAAGTDPIITRIGLPASPPMVQSTGFADVLSAGVRHVETKLAQADDLVRRFALDDSVPLHQVTYALEEARMAVELAMQVRSKLVDGYREIMNMQL
ncbi:flagellar hook-basal body complex protein FliE [Sphingomonas sp.]|jgi:flagellar hook-basal body complex protein FliE|uniref:flagellar hook-basal body complex protein FliE n=1 Tax=Sphingomonas sp. TaxID=28214 RepID=UPI00356177AF